MLSKVDVSKVLNWRGYNASQPQNPPYVPLRLDVSCPTCHRSLINHSALNWGMTQKRPACISVLTCNGCGESVFFVIFKTPQEKTDMAYNASLIYMYPNAPVIPQIRQQMDQIQPISPLFVEAYEQAIMAKRLGLGHLAGMGMRKALEFLIKDYAIHRDQDNAEKIAKSFLSDCIKKYFAGTRIERVATLTSWLGNDETHYQRRHSDLDVTDLEKLLNITVLFVSSELVADSYEESMSKN